MSIEKITTPLTPGQLGDRVNKVIDETNSVSQQLAEKVDKSDTTLNDNLTLQKSIFARQLITNDKQLLNVDSNGNIVYLGNNELGQIYLQASEVFASTPPANDNSKKIATTEWMQNDINRVYSAYTYYNANTDSFTKENRLNAIYYVFNTLGYKKYPALIFSIRYYGGYYEEYFARQGAGDFWDILAICYDSKTIRFYNYNTSNNAVIQLNNVIVE